MNNLPKVVAQQRHGRASNRKSDALPLSHSARATTQGKFTGMMQHPFSVYLESFITIRATISCNVASVQKKVTSIAAERECLSKVNNKKLDPFSFQHNFDKHCRILIIPSLLQT